MADVAYQETRRKGRRASIVQVGEVTSDPETGRITAPTTVTNVRLAVKEQTSYSRAIKARACQQDVGDTTFIFWTRDIPSITRLYVEDYIYWEGVKYQVVNSVVEETAFVVTAKAIEGATGKQEVSLDVGNSLSIDQTNSPTVE